MIVDMLSNKNLNPIVTELFVKGTKLSITLIFMTQFSFSVLKIIRLNSTYDFIIKIPNKQELWQITFNQSSDISFENYNSIKKFNNKTIIVFSDWYHSGIRYSFRFQKESLERL